MCGIFAVLRDESERVPPTSAQIEELLEQVCDTGGDWVSRLEVATAKLFQINDLLKGPAGVRALIGEKSLADKVKEGIARLDVAIDQLEAELDSGQLGDSLESINSILVSLKDAIWAVERDRLQTANAVADLLHSGGADPNSKTAVDAYASVQATLSAIDRLEVRGRDSAGIAVIVEGHGMRSDDLAGAVRERDDELLRSGSLHSSNGNLVFVYKAAAEIGALGDNVNHLREAIAADHLLARVLSQRTSRVSIVSHTRWASVGTVSEPNAHPVDSREIWSGGPNRSYVIAALNGDVDNYATLKTTCGLEIADDITTDAKVIPTLFAHRLSSDSDPLEAFRLTVAQFEGSVAIAAAIVDQPDKLFLAVRGSGQGCYVGLGEGTFLVASEPYGLVEECAEYFRIDGEHLSPKSGVNGQVVELRRSGAGTLAAVRRITYDGDELPVTDGDLVIPEVTTRDIDRGGAPHFLLKEISESPESIRRTLRGKLLAENAVKSSFPGPKGVSASGSVDSKGNDRTVGRLRVALPEEAFPSSIRNALSNGTIKQIICIGQGTAAVASRSLPAVLESVSANGIRTTTKLATELSGFGMHDDMSDTLVVAVSQSGTTTDTNRTVDLVRSRGAKVIAIVNRRQSDLTKKADAVLYTSDGRDVEMSVASTKAFYAQVAATTLLAIAIADASGEYDRSEAEAVLRALRKLPDAMTEVLDRRSEIAAVAQEFAPSRRSWAIVGNGPNFIAAQEVRIKLSELCYKSIAVDGTEDKKHIDLSAEPMIILCAAGLSGANAADVVKEVAIYKAHKATPIVIASEGSEFDDAAALITVPALHPIVDFVLSTMVGHLFGYEAALAINEQSRLMRVARAALDDVIAVHDGDDDLLLSQVRMRLDEPSRSILSEIRAGALDGHLSSSTAARVASLLRYATGVFPMDSLEMEMGRPVSPLQMAGELTAALSAAVDELTRPIDAVKHQAKTVTVGISRTEDTFTDSMLVKHVITSGAERDRVSYRSMRMLAALDAAVEDVIGFTHYGVEGDVMGSAATIRVLEKGGIAEKLTSRADSDPRLTGTKHRAAYERMVTVGRGQRDGRSVIIVPESRDQYVSGITLLHVRFREHLEPEAARAVLIGYRNRYSALVDAVMETESHFDDEILGDIPILDLLVDPVWVLSEYWRQS